MKRFLKWLRLRKNRQQPNGRIYGFIGEGLHLRPVLKNEHEYIMRTLLPFGIYYIPIGDNK